MNIGDFNLRQLENISSNNSIKKAISNFMIELSNNLEKNQDKKLEEKINEIRKFRKNE